MATQRPMIANTRITPWPRVRPRVRPPSQAATAPRTPGPPDQKNMIVSRDRAPQTIAPIRDAESDLARYSPGSTPISRGNGSDEADAHDFPLRGGGSVRVQMEGYHQRQIDERHQNAKRIDSDDENPSRRNPTARSCRSRRRIRYDEHLQVSPQRAECVSMTGLRPEMFCAYDSKVQQRSELPEMSKGVRRPHRPSARLSGPPSFTLRAGAQPPAPAACHDFK
jgi:hypothetical protein